VVAGIEAVAGTVKYADCINLQAESVGIGNCATVVIDDGL